jgi:uncharacterized protein YkwD
MFRRSRQRPESGVRHRARRRLLVLPLLVALAAVPVPAGRALPAVVTAVHAADCPLPPALCPPPSDSPTPLPTSPPHVTSPAPPPPAAGPGAPTTPAPPAATPARHTPTPQAANASPPPHAGAPPAPPAGASPPAAGASPPVLTPRTGAVPDRGARVRSPATATPSRPAVQVWAVPAAIGVLLALGLLLALRMRRLSRRAALYARFNRMRAEQGLAPLTPDEIELSGRRRWRRFMG